MKLMAHNALWLALLLQPFVASAANNPPSIALYYPANTATFSAPATIPLAVRVSDSDGTIAKVDYYLGATFLGTVTTAPFSANLSGVGAGTYTFTAKATDNLGAVTTSNSVTTTVYNVVAGNTAPTINVTLPAVNGSAYSLNAGPVQVPVLLNATDTGGSVNRVELLVNGSYIGTALGGVLNSGLVFSNPGSYSISARAFDNLGVVATSAAKTISVYANVAGNAAPTVNLTNPLAGALYLPPATISVVADASDAGGSVNRVEFFLNNGLLNVMAAAPYTFNLGGVTAGSFTFRARAYDSYGVYTDSANIAVTVNTPPTVTLSSPVNNTVFNAPASFTLQANVSDVDNNVSKVEFYQGTALLGVDTSFPYSWLVSSLPWGNYTYTAKAYDALGAIAASSAISVVTNEPPSISLTAAEVYGGYNAPADIALTATSADVDGTISKVEFYSGSTLIGTRTTPPYTHTATGVPAGSHVYTAKVYDNRSAVTTSSAVHVVVSALLTPATFTYDELGRLIGVQH